MSEPFFFGDEARALFGMLHSRRSARMAPASSTGKPACVVCAPLLQDATRIQRAMWHLAESLAEAQHDVLRFDWYGSGDSAGDGADLRLEGMAEDLEAAIVELSTSTRAGRLSVLAFRSAALPVLAHATASKSPVDLVLWDPILDGAALVEDWQRQQVEQLTVAGRYPFGTPASEPGELMGHEVGDALLDALRSTDHSRVGLPAGSRILVAAWRESQCLSAFIEWQRGQGIEVECLWLDAGETPAFDVPRQFEAQVFPRRSVGMLVERITGMAA
ncbi:hypothetical protein [Marilutibacter spongiae]|uniref:Serine aminopeptidase S33 domain-containing protein n=1 Tax=Marilutibacter spongiae TaxID=2025720 RepID=A0A7W3Y704_9GAMM|nr:hypothetical protein [Lysobacter spongiae]MBB1061456.1 hypothetical protein [Lysobacter spongiae]